MAETAVQSNNKAVTFRGRTEREMPVKQGTSPETISSNIGELHTGETYAHTAKKFGKERANKQAVAIALDTARKSGAKIPKKKHHRKAIKHAQARGLISEKAAKQHLGE